MAVSETDFAGAEARMQALRQAGHAVAARYDRRSRRVVVRMSTEVEVSFPVALAEGLTGAAPDDLAEIELSPGGLGLHWPRLDADIYVPALLRGVFGSSGWMAEMGAAGGRVRSDAKAAASRANGLKGGRPRKAAGGSP